jgi:peptidoglycan/xylan/chitin deacetylase (PgdA/CDA1 family)
MYHSISPAPEGKMHPYFRVTTTPTVFENQLRLLHKSNYTAIRVKEIDATKHHFKNVVLTFDDAFDDFYTNAFPLINALKFTATVFIPTDLVGSSNRLVNGKSHLSWAQIRELDTLGIEFGSHSVSHPILKTMPRQQIATELIDSKKAIEDKLGHAVSSFSYPYALPDGDPTLIAFLAETLKQAGYTHGVSTRIGLCDTKNVDVDYFLRRIPVNSSDDDHFFTAKLVGAYDWLRMPQFLIKKIRRSSSFSSRSK